MMKKKSTASPNGFGLLEVMIAMLLLTVIMSDTGRLQFTSIMRIMHHHNKLQMLYRLKKELFTVLATKTPDEKIPVLEEGGDDELRIFFDVQPVGEKSLLGKSGSTSLYVITATARWLELNQKQTLSTGIVWYYPSDEEDEKQNAQPEKKK